MYVVKALFVELYSEGGKNNAVKERTTYGRFPVADAKNIDALVQSLAARHECVSVGLELITGDELELPNDKIRELP